MTAPNEVPPWQFPTGANQPPAVWPPPSPVASPPPSNPPVPTGVTNTEPVRAANAVQSLPIAVLTFVVAFEIWSPTDIQWAAILGLYTALSIKVSELARGKVSSPATVARLMADKK